MGQTSFRACCLDLFVKRNKLLNSLTIDRAPSAIRFYFYCKGPSVEGRHWSVHIATACPGNYFPIYRAWRHCKMLRFSGFVQLLHILLANRPAIRKWQPADSSKGIRRRRVCKSQWLIGGGGGGRFRFTFSYVDLNPVAARLVDTADGWRWSSERSRLVGRRVADDPLTDVGVLGAHVRNWRQVLRHGLAAGDLGSDGEVVAKEIEARLRTGRPLAGEDWIVQQEAALRRPLTPQKPGRKPRPDAGVG